MKVGISVTNLKTVILVVAEDIHIQYVKTAGVLVTFLLETYVQESVTVFVMDAHQTITLFVIVMLAFMRAFAFVSQFPN